MNFSLEQILLILIISLYIVPYLNLEGVFDSLFVKVVGEESFFLVRVSIWEFESFFRKTTSRKEPRRRNRSILTGIDTGNRVPTLRMMVFNSSMLLELARVLVSS